MKRILSSICAGFIFSVATVWCQELPGQEVGRVGEHVITLEDVDAAWEKSDPSDHSRTWQSLYTGRRKALDNLIARALIADAAHNKGVSTDDFLAEELERRIDPVIEKDVLEFYEQNKEEFQGQSLNEMESAIRKFLEQQTRLVAYDRLVADLRKNSAVQVSLEPPRSQINIDPQDPIRGNVSAAVTIIEFSDFQCPFCASVTPTLAMLLKDYSNSVRLIWKDFPLLQIHPKAKEAAAAAHCAGEQGKYWEYHDRLFADQESIEQDSFFQHANAIVLDELQFKTCVSSGKYEDKIQKSIVEGRDIGVSSTPTVFINGRRVVGAQPYEIFSEIIEEELILLESQ